jgi:hypothetical protein
VEIATPAIEIQPQGVKREFFVGVVAAPIAANTLAAIVDATARTSPAASGSRDQSTTTPTATATVSTTSQITYLKVRARTPYRSRIFGQLRSLLIAVDTNRVYRRIAARS